MADKPPYKCEYAKSARSKCVKCKGKIEKGSIRIGTLEAATNFDGMIYRWKHVACFFKDNTKVKSTSEIAGFDMLRPEDQPKLKKFTAKRKKDDDDDGDNKKRKKEGEEEEEEEEEEEKKGEELEYVKKLWELKDKILLVVKTTEMKAVLEKNNQSPKGGKETLAQKIADCILRGGLPECPKCKNGVLSYAHGKYFCKNDATDWSKCTYTSDTADRIEWKHPKWWKKRLATVEPKGKKRSTSTTKSESRSRSGKRRKKNDPSTEESSEEPVFSGLRFHLLGKLSKKFEDIKSDIVDAGGKVLKRFAKTIDYVISSEDELASHEKTVMKAVDNDIPVLTEDFLTDCITSNKIEDISLYLLSLDTIEEEEEEGEEESDSDVETESQKKKKRKKKGKEAERKSAEEEYEEGKMKYIKKGRAGVDPYSGLGNKAHVLEEGDEIFNVMLNRTDITKGPRGTNSFYVLQVLEHDTKAKWWCLRRWGRVGETSTKKLTKYTDKQEAIDEFEEQYFDKTKNEWENRESFAKKPGKFYPVELDYGDDGDLELIDLSKATGSKLDSRVQELICLLFDIEKMKQTMMELEVDIKKMPLGKLTKNHIQTGYQTLTTIQELLEEGDTKLNEGALVDATNKFYTLIPHVFEGKPPIIDNEELLKDKIKLIEALQDIEIAATLLKKTKEDDDDDDDDDDSSSSSPIDESYKKLNTIINPLDKSSDKFKIIKKYTEEGHDKKYFRTWDLEVLDIFEIERPSEEKHFSAWKDNENKQLLWHGSRLTNFVGILSQGLRIAPPEAPKTGYRFGKGVYFADTISKSASYCRTSAENPTGIMILNEVALGRMNELLHDQYMEKPTRGTDCTKALGGTAPDPKEDVWWDDIKVPCGKPIRTGINSSCSHNEYIVYNTDQIRIRYLIKTRFNYKKSKGGWY